MTPQPKVQRLATWLFLSLAAGLIPFLFAALAYRAFYVPPPSHHHRNVVHVFPTWSMILGRGDLFSIVFGLAGASIGELLTFEVSGFKRSSLIGVSSLVGLAAMMLFTVLTYATLTHQHIPVDRPFVMSVGLVLLAVSAVVQALVIVTAPS
jgi:hypothetical protein